MNDKPENKTVAVAKPPLVAGGSAIAIIPKDMDQAWRLAGAITQSNMAPASYNRDQNAIMVGIMHGMEVGLPPMAALQSIAIINGRPTIWGDGAMALILGSGFVEDMVENIVGEGEAAVAHCKITRKGQSEPIERTFSIEDAKTAGLLSKKGPWQQYPKRMLQMRARSWAMRDGFADVLKGLHIREEVDDMVLVPSADGTYEARPEKADYQEAAETYKLIDEFGETVLAELLEEHFVEHAIGDINRIAETGIRERLNAFLEFNEPEFDRLGPDRESESRQAINRAVNAAKQATVAEPEADEEPADETPPDDAIIDEGGEPVNVLG